MQRQRGAAAVGSAPGGGGARSGCLRHEAADFLLHPVFLDCSTIVPLFPLHDRLDQASLFIPFAIEEFQARRAHRAPRRARAGGALDRRPRQAASCCATASGSSTARDTSWSPFGISRSRRCARCRTSGGCWRRASPFRLKRGQGSATAALRLKAEATAVLAVPAPANAAVAATGDPISDLIGELLGRNRGTSSGIRRTHDKPFFELGLDSLALLDAAEALEKRLGVRLYPTALFENPDVAALTSASASDVSRCVRRVSQHAHNAATGTATTIRPDVVAAVAPATDQWRSGTGTHRRARSPAPRRRLEAGKRGDAPSSISGLDSMVLLDLADALEQRLGVRLYPTVLFERPNAAALVSYLREEFPEACARIRGPARGCSTGHSHRHAPSPRQRIGPRCWCRAGSLLVLISSPSSAQAIALLGVGGDAGLRERLEAELGSRVSFRGGVAEFSAALAAGLSCDEVCLVAVDHDFAFAVVKALIQANRLHAPLTLRAITLDCFRVHEETPREDAAHGVWGLLQSLSREYPQVSVSQVDLSTDDVVSATNDWIPLALAAAPTRTLRAIRAGRAYQRVLCPARSVRQGRPPPRRSRAKAGCDGAGPTWWWVARAAWASNSCGTCAGTTQRRWPWWGAGRRAPRSCARSRRRGNTVARSSICRRRLTTSRR